VLGPRLHLIEN